MHGGSVCFQWEAKAAYSPRQACLCDGGITQPCPPGGALGGGQGAGGRGWLLAAAAVRAGGSTVGHTATTQTCCL